MVRKMKSTRPDDLTPTSSYLNKASVSQVAMAYKATTKTSLQHCARVCIPY